MDVLLSIFYLLFGFVFFKRKIKISWLLSSFLFYLSIHIQDNLAIKSIFIFIALLLMLALFFLERKQEWKKNFYFSIPCWIIILSVTINLFSSS